MPIVIAILALIPTVTLLGATAADKQPELCAFMEGEYKPQNSPGDICPGGKWGNVYLLAKEKVDDGRAKPK